MMMVCVAIYSSAIAWKCMLFSGYFFCTLVYTRGGVGEECVALADENCKKRFRQTYSDSGNDCDTRKPI